MKVSQIVLLGSAATALTSSLLGFAEFARGEVLLSTTGRATYDSRVFGGLNPADDYIFTLEPRLIYRREAGLLKLDSHAGLRVNRYEEFQELDSEDFFTSVRLSLPPGTGTVASGSFETSYDERTDVNYDVNARMREKTFHSRLNTLFPTGLKTSVSVGGSYRKEDRAHFNDREIWEGTAAFRYTDFLGGSTFEARYRRLDVESTGLNFLGVPLDQKSDIYSVSLSRPIYHDVRGSISYGYRVLHRSRAEVAGMSNRAAGSIIAVNIEGPFLPATRFPKLESSLSFGYQEAETPGIADTGGSRFFGAARLGWHARERTQVYIQARRALELSIEDLTIETTSGEIGVSQSVGNFTHLSASIGYEERDYRTLTRQDEAFTAHVGANYRITQAWSAAANYRLRATDSSSTSADYDRHVVWISATYTF
jgi:Uncharacterized protein conserved in bacteria